LPNNWAKSGYLNWRRAEGTQAVTRRFQGVLAKNNLKAIKVMTMQGRCYDFKNIFAEKFCEKIGVFCSKQS
jgi:hypothetical protein